MRRRDLLLLATSALVSALAPPRASAQSAPKGVASNFGPWGFDRSGADFTVRPGDDFFRYCNGKWLDRTAIAPDRSVNGVDIALRDEAEANIRTILERGATGVEPALRDDATRIGTFYANFMDEARVEALDSAPIAPALERIRAATSHADLAGLMGLAKQSFFATIFDLTIEIDAKAPDRYAVLIAQGGLDLPNRDYYLTPQFSTKKTAFRAHIETMLGLIGWPEPQASAAAVFDFESAIAERSWTLVESRDSDKTYNPTSPTELARAAPFPWTELFRAAQLQTVDRFVVSEVTAIPKIAALYASTPLDTLKAWQAFRTTDNAAALLSKRFDLASFEFHDRTLSGVAELPPRWKRALRTVEEGMGEAIGRLYVAKHFSPDAKAQIDVLVERVRQGFKARIEAAAWMEPATKAKALDKLARLKAKIAYPSKWRDYSSLPIRPNDLVDNVVSGKKFDWMRKVARLNAPVDRDEWEMSPQTVDAWYSSNRNDITLPAAQLQPPFFDPAADLAVNYGGIGALIGHELTHGFDDDGRKYDPTGALVSWWTDTDVEEFVKRSAGLGRQFDMLEPYPGARVNGDLTMGENIADLGGALIALDGYHLALEGKAAPVLDGWIGDQRFFLSYAQSWRTKRTEDSDRQRLVSDPHAPVQYRVNEIVRNMDAWYQAFDIKPGDKLYLATADRVRIW